uniref:Uncharacterized protein n=1 Tax=Mycobacterium riyadhense TaxID=486698 RepID=A0A653EYV1_9MYCO|nr:hypothetical protein BIN_B_04579 [Mycobacterium riyadhense]
MCSVPMYGVIQSDGLVQRVLERAFAPWRERNVAAGRLRSGTYPVNDCAAERVRGNAQRRKRMTGHRVGAGQQPQQDVFGADEVVLQFACRLLCENNSATRRIGEFLEHSPITLRP